MNKTTTLLFNQAAIKAVRMTEEVISVWYADGHEPIHINKDDVLYEHHKKEFDELVQTNLGAANKAE